MDMDAVKPMQKHLFNGQQEVAHLAASALKDMEKISIIKGLRLHNTIAQWMTSCWLCPSLYIGYHHTRPNKAVKANLLFATGMRYILMLKGLTFSNNL